MPDEAEEPNLGAELGLGPPALTGKRVSATGTGARESLVTLSRGTATATATGVGNDEADSLIVKPATMANIADAANPVTKIRLALAARARRGRLVIVIVAGAVLMARPIFVVIIVIIVIMTRSSHGRGDGRRSYGTD